MTIYRNSHDQYMQLNYYAIRTHKEIADKTVEVNFELKLKYNKRYLLDGYILSLSSTRIE